jgi:hypothetical protein
MGEMLLSPFQSRLLLAVVGSNISDVLIA